MPDRYPMRRTSQSEHLRRLNEYLEDIDGRLNQGGGPTPMPGLRNPVFTYTGSNLTRVDYEGGPYKALTYVNNLLATLEFFNGAVTITKTFNYTNGVLTSVTEA